MLRLERQRGRTREYWQLELDGTTLTPRSGKGLARTSEGDPNGCWPQKAPPLPGTHKLRLPARVRTPMVSG